MKNNFKLLILLFSIVILIVTVLTVGWKMSKDEKQYLRMRERESLESVNLRYQSIIKNFLSKYQKILDPLIDRQSFNEEDARETIRNNPYIDKIFILNPNGQLLFPFFNTDKSSQSEKDFLVRTSDIWKQRTLFSLNPPSEADSKISYSRQVTQDSSWFPYQWHDGLHLLYFTKDESGMRGVEINSSRFVAELLNSLAEEEILSAIYNINLKNEKDQILYKSGDNEKPASIEMEDTLSSPLTSWKIQIRYIGSEISPDSFKFNILSGSLLLVTLIVFVSLYFFREYKKELKEAEQKVSFVNQISHELKTPLTNIRMYAELLQMDLNESEEKSKNYIDVIVRESQRLSRLIGNVLSYGQQERKALRFNPVSDNINDIVEQAVAFFKPILIEKGIEVNLSKVTPEERLIDRDIVSQILYNLLSNAEKYAIGTVQIDISSYLENNFVIINIRDYGPGIPANSKKKIFEPFFRVSNSMTDGVSGAGIGLTISSELARLHGGVLELIETNKGALFQIRIKAPLKGE